MIIFNMVKSALVQELCMHRCLPRFELGKVVNLKAVPLDLFEYSTL